MYHTRRRPSSRARARDRAVRHSLPQRPTSSFVSSRDARISSQSPPPPLAPQVRPSHASRRASHRIASHRIDRMRFSFAVGGAVVVVVVGVSRASRVSRAVDTARRGRLEKYISICARDVRDVRVADAVARCARQPIHPSMGRRRASHRSGFRRRAMGARRATRGRSRGDGWQRMGSCALTRRVARGPPSPRRARDATVDGVALSTT